MTQTFPQEWENRREIPNPQIRDVADQYEQARQILSLQPLGTGILLPLMNTASMAIELYLKCLAGEVVHISEGEGMAAGISPLGEFKSERVHAQASAGGHDYRKILGAIDEDIRSLLETSYAKVRGNEFKSDLMAVDNALVVTRYPFEPSSDLERISLKTLMSLSEFLRDFVVVLEPREIIRWKDESISKVEDV
ncbi:MAG: hypothetical protein OXL41_09420 [Nitrospinae bacterium]|nr:hypothetical protein [Nitrospinota bacterium]